MAFSNAEYQYLESLFNSYYSQGYKSYVAYTNTSYNDSSKADMYVYFSKEDIVANSLTCFSIPSNSILCTVYTGDYYNGYGSTQYIGSRYTSIVVNAKSLDIPVYEHIYSNASSSSESLIIADPFRLEVINHEITFATNAVMCCMLMFSVLCRVFWRR